MLRRTVLRIPGEAVVGGEEGEILYVDQSVAVEVGVRVPVKFQRILRKCGERRGANGCTHYAV